MASFFSALRLRMLAVFVPSTKSNGDGGRAGWQSSLEQTQGGRVTKRSRMKTEKRNMKHLVIAARKLEMDGADGGCASSSGSTNWASSDYSPKGAPSQRSNKTPTSTHRYRSASRTPQILITPIKSETKTQEGGSRYGILTPKLSTSKVADKSMIEEVEDTLDVRADTLLRHCRITKKHKPDWSQTEIDFFNKLNSRGFEKLLPSSFKMDFPTVPLSLFADGNDYTFIHSLSGNNFRASRALLALFPLGSRVRDRLENGLSPVSLLSHAITEYIRWSHEDAGLDHRNLIPALAVICAHPGEDTDSLVARTEIELKSLGRQYRDEFRIVPSLETDVWDRGREEVPPVEAESGGQSMNESESEAFESSLPPTPSISPWPKSAASTTKEYFNPPLPTLFGFAIIHTVVSLVTHDTSKKRAVLRPLAVFDFGVYEQDAWNAIAIAMAVIWVRNFHVELDWPRVKPQAKSDPDA